MDAIPDVQPFVDRFKALEVRMAAEDFYEDQRSAAAVGREYCHIRELLESHRHYESLIKTLADAEEILNAPNAEEEMRLWAREEQDKAREQVDAAKFRVLSLMLPEDPSDSRNTVLEIRAGAGGDEAAIFAGDLCRMYVRFSDLRGWTVEPMSSHGAELGGFKEVILLISGEDVYKALKFESGVHRVQRIPETEANGRVHTSTVTVAVLPEAEEVDVQINPDDLEISICRASGAGGQHVNKTDSAVQLLHKPTGIIVYCADERSQQKNRVKAMKVLRSRLLEQKQRAEEEKYASTRRNQVGSGDRSERIRTYNFPQNRLTDHRIGLTLYNLPAVMEGDLTDVIAALHTTDYQNRIQALLPR
ncbi:MAG: peptide chain release factor 1 [Puniceicoccales bacterium]|jgi:peptide chain release factor 1|nr:peptide chain release factor 1 [Puniceicoccales bacterium]